MPASSTAGQRKQFAELASGIACENSVVRQVESCRKWPLEPLGYSRCEFPFLVPTQIRQAFAASK